MAAHEDKQVRYAHEHFVAEWLAISVRPQSPFCSSSSAVTYDRDPEAGAITLISEIRDRCSKLGFANSTVPAVIWVLLEDAAEGAAEQRRPGRLDDARATAARLMTLGRRLVQEYPDSALSYRVLSEAHSQNKKNAYRTCDHNLIEESLVQAVEAAQRSLALAPDRLETRGYLDKITEQLASVKADRLAAGSSRSK